MDHKLSNSTGGNAGVTEVDLTSTTEVWRTNTSCPSESPHSKQASSVLCLVVAARCCNVLRHLDGRFIGPNRFSQLQNHHGTRLWMRLRFLGFFKGALLSDFKKTVKIELLITVVQRLEDIFSMVRMNLLPWLDKLGLGANDVNAEWQRQVARLLQSKIRADSHPRKQ